MKNLFTAFLSMFIVACSTPEKNANSKIDIYDDSVLDIIDIYSEIEVLADSISLPEGPVWDEASQSLLFVDVMGNKLYRWNENDGTSEYISPSGNTGYAPNVDFGLLGANGLLIDENGDIILCQHGDRRLAKINNSSTNSPSFTTLVDNYEGGRFNSPNDLTYASNGDIYFTDPAFGFFNLETFQFVESELKDLNFNGVYKYNTKSGELSLVTDKIDLPNGIALSPDEKTLYVAETEGGKLYGFDIIGEGEINKIQFPHSINGGKLLNNEGGIKRFDSLAVEKNGNICVGTLFNGGISVISPSGDLVEFIKFEDPYITNICFGSKDLKTAYITASYKGHLLEVKWDREGLPLNFLNK